jgi:hypothetical protein
MSSTDLSYRVRGREIRTDGFPIPPDCRELNMRQRHIMPKMDRIHHLAR